MHIFNTDSSVWPGQDAVGKCLYLGSEQDAPCTRVVGVIAYAHRKRVEEEPAPQYYLPMSEDDSAQPRALVVRVRGTPEDAVPAVTQTLLGGLPGLRLVRTRCAGCPEVESRPDLALDEDADEGVHVHVLVRRSRGVHRRVVEPRVPRLVQPARALDGRVGPVVELERREHDDADPVVIDVLDAPDQVETHRTEGAAGIHVSGLGTLVVAGQHVHGHVEAVELVEPLFAAPALGPGGPALQRSA